jgi:hypothetical protein
MIQSILEIEDDIVTIFLNREIFEFANFCHNIVAATRSFLCAQTQRTKKRQ